MDISEDENSARQVKLEEHQSGSTALAAVALPTNLASASPPSTSKPGTRSFIHGPGLFSSTPFLTPNFTGNTGLPVYHFSRDPVSASYAMREAIEANPHLRAEITVQYRREHPGSVDDLFRAAFGGGYHPPPLFLDEQPEQAVPVLRPTAAELGGGQINETSRSPPVTTKIPPTAAFRCMCDGCNYVVRVIDAHNHFTRVHHIPGDRSICPWENCTRRFEPGVNLYKFSLEHMRGHVGFMCDYCEKMFTSYQAWKTHVKQDICLRNDPRTQRMTPEQRRAKTETGSIAAMTKRRRKYPEPLRWITYP
jgi:hypothetical protein